MSLCCQKRMCSCSYCECLCRWWRSVGSVLRSRRMFWRTHTSISWRCGARSVRFSLTCSSSRRQLSTLARWWRDTCKCVCVCFVLVSCSREEVFVRLKQKVVPSEQRPAGNGHNESGSDALAGGTHRGWSWNDLQGLCHPDDHTRAHPSHHQRPGGTPHLKRHHHMASHVQTHRMTCATRHGFHMGIRRKMSKNTHFTCDLHMLYTCDHVKNMKFMHLFSTSHYM